MTAMVTHKIVLKRNGKVTVDGRFIGWWRAPEKDGNALCRRKEWTFSPRINPNDLHNSRKVYRELTRNRLLSAIDVYAIFN